MADAAQTVKEIKDKATDPFIGDVVKALLLIAVMLIAWAVMEYSGSGTSSRRVRKPAGCHHQKQYGSLWHRTMSFFGIGRGCLSHALSSDGAGVPHGVNVYENFLQ